MPLHVIPFALACAVCATIDSTLTASGEEEPFRGRLRLDVDVREGHIEAGGIALDDHRAEIGVAWSPLRWFEVGLAFPYLLRDFSTWNAATVGDTEIRARTLAYETRGAFGRRRFGLLGILKLPTAPVESDPAGTPLPSVLQPGCSSIAPELGGYYAWSHAAWSTYVSASVLLPFVVRDAPHAGDSLRIAAHVQYQYDVHVGGRLGLFARIDGNGELATAIDDPSSGGFVGYVTGDVVVSVVPDLVLTAGVLLPVVQVLRGDHHEGVVAALTAAYDF